MFDGSWNQFDFSYINNCVYQLVKYTTYTRLDEF